MLLGVIGHDVDGRLGTGFLLAFVFGAAGLACESYRFVRAYTAKMKLVEKGKPWAK
jgi:hypothetical protein